MTKSKTLNVLQSLRHDLIRQEEEMEIKLKELKKRRATLLARLNEIGSGVNL